MDCELLPSREDVFGMAADTRLDFENRLLYTSGAEGYMRVFDADVTHTEPFPVALIEFHEDSITSVDAHVSFLSLDLVPYHLNSS